MIPRRQRRQVLTPIHAQYCGWGGPRGCGQGGIRKGQRVRRSHNWDRCGSRSCTVYALRSIQVVAIADRCLTLLHNHRIHVLRNNGVQAL